MKLKWTKDHATECGRFSINTAKIRWGNKYETEYELMEWISDKRGGFGPTLGRWKLHGLYGPPLREVKKIAEAL